MKLLSTKNKNAGFTFAEAVIKGLAADGGLFFPSEIPKLPENFLTEIQNKSFTDIAYEVSRLFIDDIEQIELKAIINEAVNFPAPVVKLSEDFSVLELFHGNTCAFKDFGARFLAGILSHYLKKSNQRCTILVATSGDTGSAVASGFYGKENIDVVLLYPSQKVSRIQEQQLTTFGKNITAFEILGTFDDCQRLVKTAFMDTGLTERYFLSSANSINIGRLLPQTFYYFEAYKQTKDAFDDIVFVVPSGNLGNLTSGLLAKSMGLPVKYFVSALNKNDIFKTYLETGKFEPIESIKTISNAMDVGNPSNLERIRFMYNDNISEIKSFIHPFSFDDLQTRMAIEESYNKFNYIFDPHGAVGFLAALADKSQSNSNTHYIILETAHPAKFLDEIADSGKYKVKIPDKLEAFLSKPKKSIPVKTSYDMFKLELLKVLKI